ncbi:MAG TPA: DUF885 domain-containing protein [Gemmatimonadales bacterium]|nr:DUF885 domain-containing protein [Gemmatimonadales bacterium]
MAVLLGCGGTTPPASTPAPSTAAAAGSQRDEGARASRQVTALADEYWKELIETFPLYGLFFGVPETPNDRLSDNSISTLRAFEQKEDRWIQRLTAIDQAALHGRPEEITYGVLRETLEASRQQRVCHGEYWPLNQQSGLQIALPFISQLQPLGSDELRQAALDRWRAMPKYIDREIQSLREGLRRGYTLPQANVRSVVEQVDALLKYAPAESPFAAITKRDSSPEFRAGIVRIVAEEIAPALKRYRDFLTAEYLPKARQSTAITGLPQGAECYRARVRNYTTANLTPQEVHQLGLEEMRRIESEISNLGQRLFGTSDVPQLIARLRDDPALRFKSREELITTAERAIERARAAMPKWFGRLPRAQIVVDPCLPHEEKKGCPNSYVPGTPDGKRPGRWRINAGNPTEQPRASMEGTAFHEGIPGHHLQGSLGQERADVHPLTQYSFFSGFGEGWALYAERLADEMGLYSSDLDRIGDAAGGQALRAARLVVDPGLHVLGWSRQRAIDYMLAHVPEPREYIESEVDRYIADPGQATAYMIGRLEIERLRQEAEKRLGSRFDIREFHDRVLENGAVPLPMLRDHIEKWVEATSRTAAAR